MPLLINSLLELTGGDGTQDLVRVLHIDRASDSVFVIRIDRPDALPVASRLSEIEAGLAEAEDDVHAEAARLLTTRSKRMRGDAP